MSNIHIILLDPIGIMLAFNNLQLTQEMALNNTGLERVQKDL